MTLPHLSFLGDSCLSIAFEERIDPAVNERCLELAAAICARNQTGIRDVVPSFHTVTVHFDPLGLDRDSLVDEVRRAAAAVRVTAHDGSPALELPVRYGGEDGPDLAVVAEFACCSEAEVIRLHTATEYRVYMLGFLPGFAYMGAVNPRIAMPRLDIPRAKVAAGSVGIAGLQTGVYPCDTPGGWRIIGRTPAPMFDLAQPNLALLKPGQRVRFRQA